MAAFLLVHNNNGSQKDKSAIYQQKVGVPTVPTIVSVSKNHVSLLYFHRLHLKMCLLSQVVPTLLTAMEVRTQVL